MRYNSGFIGLDKTPTASSQSGIHTPVNQFLYQKLGLWRGPPVSLGTYTIVQTFTATSTWTCPAGVSEVEYLVVAGGGGAGAIGGAGDSSNGGTGGTGVSVSITGSAITYAGGGGGASYPSNAGAGGSGGGGAGAIGMNNATAGTANTGGGGGGCRVTDDTAGVVSGAGGSGEGRCYAGIVGSPRGGLPGLAEIFLPGEVVGLAGQGDYRAWNRT